MPYTVLMPTFAAKILHGGVWGLGLLMGRMGGRVLGALTLASRTGVKGLGAHRCNFLRSIRPLLDRVRDFKKLLVVCDRAGAHGIHDHDADGLRVERPKRWCRIGCARADDGADR